RILGLLVIVAIILLSFEQEAIKKLRLSISEKYLNFNIKSYFKIIVVFLYNNQYCRGNHRSNDSGIS
ncbi:MAG: hypothetical protein ACI89M_001077, partial [Chitinophagales bacterium]